MPKDVKIQKIDDVFTALGNCIVCNDFIALIHPEFSKESEALIAKTLNV
jgi:translation initiation factor 6